LSGLGSHDPLVWYVAYGSNLRLDRLRRYLAGGRAHGAHRVHPGGRNPADPVEVERTWLEGGLRFAGKSSLWGGGVACYDREAHGAVAARAYLLTTDQVCDLVAQETRQLPGSGPLLHKVLADGFDVVSTTLYDSLVRVGGLHDLPMVTIASSRRPPVAPPSAAYVRALAAGLAESFAWSPEEIADYLLRWPGVADAWTAGRLRSAAETAGGEPWRVM
jgi:hypothetical protein